MKIITTLWTHLLLVVCIKDTTTLAGQAFYTVLHSTFFVDKTLFVKEFLEMDPTIQVTLLTYPREWGKNTNLDMLNSFLRIEMDKEGNPVPYEQRNSTTYFIKGALKISNQKIKFDNHVYGVTEIIGTYPTIYVSFNEVAGSDVEEVIRTVKHAVSRAFRQHSYLHKSLATKSKDESNPDTAKAAQSDLEQFERLYSENGLRATPHDLAQSLFFLSKLLQGYHQKKVFIFLDQYDETISNALLRNFRDLDEKLKESVNFEKELFTSIILHAFKNNPYLARGLITGVLGFGQQNFGSGFDSFVHHPCTDEKFSQFFGLTKEEVKCIVKKRKLDQKVEEEIEAWYGGYKAGNHVLFNPWSVSQYFLHNRTVSNYWTRMGPPSASFSQLYNATFKTEMMYLLNGSSLSINVEEDFNPVEVVEIQEAMFNTNQQLLRERMTFFTFLLFTGYLACSEYSVDGNPNQCIGVRVPNLELQSFYKEARDAL